MLAKSLGVFTITISKGSHFTPSISFINTWGLETDNSYPSLRIFSSSTDRCNSPLPLTLNPSLFSNSSTSKPTFVSNSRSNLSLICLLVKYFPLNPAKGLLLTKKFILNVGLSICIGGRGLGFPNEHTVSPILILEQPAIVTISP